jgi:salicylate hydroxylase
MGYEVIKVNVESNEPSVVLNDGSVLFADVVVGADGKLPVFLVFPLSLETVLIAKGLWSTIRNDILEVPITPGETGDLAYRGTFSAQQLAELKDERIGELLRSSSVQVWMGPQKHVVFYPVRSHTEFNLVLLCVETTTPLT